MSNPIYAEATIRCFTVTAVQVSWAVWGVCSDLMSPLSWNCSEAPFAHRLSHNLCFFNPYFHLPPGALHCSKAVWEPGAAEGRVLFQCQWLGAPGHPCSAADPPSVSSFHRTALKRRSVGLKWEWAEPEDLNRCNIQVPPLPACFPPALTPKASRPVSQLVAVYDPKKWTKLQTAWYDTLQSSLRSYISARSLAEKKWH